MSGSLGLVEKQQRVSVFDKVQGFSTLALNLYFFNTNLDQTRLPVTL
jgi:hypothetical protein